MTTRDRLIAEGLLEPAPPRGGPTRQRWRDEPTLRLRDIDRVRIRKEQEQP